LFLFAFCAVGCASSQVGSNAVEQTPKAYPSGGTVVSASEVTWEQLNPARGDQSPKAATLWGDRQGGVATGFLFNAVDGFRSPAHIHNVSYRGVVIRGQVHNDDPNAEDMWMPAGSFWTQPKGAVHITAAKGTDVLAYIEIDEGPYLVRPVDQAFATDEAPINVDESNIVWVKPSGAESTANGLRVSYLWGNPQADEPSGRLVRLAAGAACTFQSRGSLRAVVIQGQPRHGASKTDVASEDVASEDVALKDVALEDVPLELGSYFSSEAPTTHELTCGATEGCTFYVRSEGSFEVSES
jgi:hypothetical protein